MKSRRRYDKKQNLIFYTVKYSSVYHREDGPALIYDDSEFWYRYGLRHREDGPAVECNDLYNIWYFNGSLHREGGPAIESLAGTKKWYRHGLCHRDDGPAMISEHGELSWWLNGKRFPSKEAWFEALTPEQQQKMLFSEYFVN